MAPYHVSPRGCFSRPAVGKGTKRKGRAQALTCTGLCVGREPQRLCFKTR